MTPPPASFAGLRERVEALYVARRPAIKAVCQRPTCTDLQRGFEAGLLEARDRVLALLDAEAAAPVAARPVTRSRDELPEWSRLVLDNLKRAAEQLPHPRPAASVVFTDPTGYEVDRWPLTGGSFDKATPPPSPAEAAAQPAAPAVDAEWLASEIALGLNGGYQNTGLVNRVRELLDSALLRQAAALTLAATGSAKE